MGGVQNILSDQKQPPPRAHDAWCVSLNSDDADEEGVALLSTRQRAVQDVVALSRFCGKLAGLLRVPARRGWGLQKKARLSLHEQQPTLSLPLSLSPSPIPPPTLNQRAAEEPPTMVCQPASQTLCFRKPITHLPEARVVHSQL